MTSTVLFGDSMLKGFNEYLIRLSDTSVIVKSGLKVSTINDTHVEEIKALKPARVILGHVSPPTRYCVTTKHCPYRCFSRELGKGHTCYVDYVTCFSSSRCWL